MSHEQSNATLKTRLHETFENVLLTPGGWCYCWDSATPEVIQKMSKAEAWNFVSSAAECYS